MINDQTLFFFLLFTPRNMCCGYLLKWPQQGDSNKYPQHMFLGVLNTIFLNIFNYLPHLDLRNRTIQIIVIMNFVIKSECWLYLYPPPPNLLLLLIRQNITSKLKLRTCPSPGAKHKYLGIYISILTRKWEYGKELSAPNTFNIYVHVVHIKCWGYGVRYILPDATLIQMFKNMVFQIKVTGEDVHLSCEATQLQSQITIKHDLLPDKIACLNPYLLITKGKT